MFMLKTCDICNKILKEYYHHSGMNYCGPECMEKDGLSFSQYLEDAEAVNEDLANCDFAYWSMCNEEYWDYYDSPKEEKFLGGDIMPKSEKATMKYFVIMKQLASGYDVAIFLELSTAKSETELKERIAQSYEIDDFDDGIHTNCGNIFKVLRVDEVSKNDYDTLAKYLQHARYV